jgi:hypothetical protein
LELDLGRCQRRSNAPFEVHRVPDRGGPAGGRRWGADRRGDPEARDQPGNLLHWKSKYGGATVAELKRLRELEAENAKLKRMYAELALENAAIKDVLSRKL